MLPCNKCTEILQKHPPQKLYSEITKERTLHKNIITHITFIFTKRSFFKQMKHMMHKIDTQLLCRHLGCHTTGRPHPSAGEPEVGFLGTVMWNPRCLHSSCVSIICIMCLNCLKKDLFVNIKGYMCNYDFMRDPFYSLIWIGWVIIAFVEGIFAKFSAFMAWQQNWLLSVCLKWNFFEKDKFPLNSKSLQCF